MARLQRGTEVFELWLDRVDGEVWPHLMVRRAHADAIDHAPAERVTLRHQFGGDREYCRLMSEYLRQGWQRVRDPAREDAIPDEPIEPTLDATLRADPGDHAAALVYADWLQQRGHPRGALIAVQHARLAVPDDPTLAAEEARLLAEHAPVLLGTLAAAAPDDGGRGLHLVWEHGFVRGARITGSLDRGESEDLLWELLRHPSARFLRELVIGCHHAGDQDNQLVSDLLLHAGPRPPLRRLVLADFDDSELDNIDISRAPLGELGGLGEAYPLLEDVVLKGTGDVELAPLALPQARRFALRTSTLRKSTLATILAAPWPELEELELWFGTPDYGADVEPDDLAGFLAGEGFPKLRVLRLMNAIFTDEICPAILRSPRLPALAALDFSLGTLSDEGAALLHAGREALAHLTSLGVFECSLTASGLAQLRAAGLPVDDRPISHAEAWREPQQKRWRFVSVSE
ncbi:MAG: TIGR02996 domain-containing protein [Deltaproteobacteria bacterium]|nr:TIGR02996 domain-containing protein [Deltaproteobacteria bacterium]MDQ3299532.1 TIGR02996 domain-containing protein [Myxococcota bacterium]